MVRRIELWSVLKVSLVFNTVMLGVVLISVALLWALANTTGLVDDLEGFLRDSGFDDFRFQGDTMFRQVAFLGGLAVLAVTVFTVLVAALVNLISEVTGGISFVVIEEITPPPTTRPTPQATDSPASSSSPASSPPSSAFPRVAPLPPVGASGPQGPPTVAWPGALPSLRATDERPGGSVPRRAPKG